MKKQVAAVLLIWPILCFGQTAQSITFPNPGDQTMGAGPITLTPTSSSGLPVTLAATPSSVCTVMPGVPPAAAPATKPAATPPASPPATPPAAPSGAYTLTLVAAGTCTVTASQAGGPGGTDGKTTYSAAASVTQVFTINSQFPGVDVVLGIGSLITANRTSYIFNTTNNNVLQGTQIGRATPQLLAGLSFQLPMRGFKSLKAEIASGAASPANKWADKYRPFHVFVSLKFSTSTNTPLIGYTFGVTYRVQKYLDFLAGYTLTEFMEPSPGFRAAAVNVVANNRNLYPTFNPGAMNNNGAGAFDGFPTQCIAGAIGCAGSTATNPATAGTSLYAGAVTEQHFRGGFMIGISVPVSLNNLFNIPKTSQ
jgi:hypothetical protein